MQLGEPEVKKQIMGLRRHVLATAIGIGIVSLGCQSLAQQQDFSKTEIETIPVAEGIYMLVGEGGNIGVSAGEDGVFMVDDQFAPLTEKIKAAIAEITDKPIRFLLNTHWHGDHTGGNENLGNAGVVIVAHDQVRERMSREQFMEAFQRTVPASPKAALPVVTFNDTTTFHLNGQTIHTFHVEPAHTDGDSVLHFKEADVIHTGDVYFNGRYPFIDTSSGGSVEGMLAAADKVLALATETTKIIPGHGSLSNRAELEVYRKMLVDVRDRTQAAIDKGTSLEDFIASKPTADYDEKWGQDFMSPEKFLTIVYKDLAKQP
ncbi:Metallo-beta-lactamase type 2 [Acaryochloris thomasi RCC1774]|uniref:beta-lactamase n=1 Tax=Acaryochloris thomasi RCC1774 TaxID=1764569 RepID=A0A2W1JPK3_9CYAN|nr:MBL fold metallo-hydrolase [Acaryochloris thomasi]PZD75176.1 Metallo-beta-lactamase type 2 [Acaryochloris thomasi RCC1774]